MATVGNISDLRGSLSQWAEFDIVHAHAKGSIGHGHSNEEYKDHDELNFTDEVIYKDRTNVTVTDFLRSCCDTYGGTPHDKPCSLEFPEVLELDPTDPIERVLIDIVKTNRKKRADYAQDGSIFSNFEQAAFSAGTTVEQGIEYMIATKQARLIALRSNGREPQNESVQDTMLDRAVYCVIALAYKAQNQ